VFTENGKCRRKGGHDMHEDRNEINTRATGDDETGYIFTYAKKPTQAGDQNRTERGKETTDKDVVYIQKNHADGR
jgi:hypothetical protein